LICAVCRKQPAQIGVLCEDCRDELEPHVSISPEQVESRAEAPTISVLIGPWGLTHRLDAKMMIGRNIDWPGIAILEASVSRHHAELARSGELWILSDLRTANGTYVDDHRIAGPTVLYDRARVRFGGVAFYFIADAPDVDAAPRGRDISDTQPIVRETATTLSMTPLGTRTFVFLEPTGGGGGVIEIDGKQVQLTIPQLELVRLLVDRMLTEHERPEGERGFVQAAELMKLSLDAAEPGVDHVRQLVRRVRRALVKAEIGDLIESRHGLGYRLRVVPRLG
jgi:pSer/pThr/pTyr-binding forkhead associated (FHA) protein